MAFFLTACLGVATAAFNSATSTAGNRVNAYTVPAPANFRCGGILNLIQPRLLWDPVTVPGGAAVTYTVTDPNNATTTTSNTYYDLKNTLPLLAGTYRLRTRIASWNGWTSAEVTRSTTLNALGLLYLCL